jgi:hypothetical protein
MEVQMYTKKGYLLFYVMGLLVNLLIPRVLGGSWNLAMAFGWTIGTFAVWLVVQKKLR